MIGNGSTRIPQRLLASHLGVTPATVSRIHRKLARRSLALRNHWSVPDDAGGGRASASARVAQLVPAAETH